jgi:hypothetical protein
MSSVISLDDYRAQHRSGPPPAPPPLPRRRVRPLGGVWVLLPMALFWLVAAMGYVVAILALCGEMRGR